MKTYSRRELYAMGEALGDSVTTKKLGGGYVCGGGGSGGGSSGPTTSTTQTSNIPEYARPYVETMLGATQQQLFNMGPSGEVQSIKPYVPYSQNATDYIAPFSPLQNQAMTGAANLQVPTEYATAAAGTTGAALDTARTAGQAGMAGQQYAAQATNPGAVGAYMNPYLQQALAPQLAQLAQQTGIQSAAQQAAATSSGAFGGTRSALQNALVQQQGNMAAQQAIAQGYNQAYNQAQQAQQYAANLGLQGQQAAMQGYGQVGQLAGQLGQLGTQRLGAEQGILGLQSQMGAQQQSQQQNIINQAVQNYAMAQQYPQQQLAFMNAQIRGLPLQTSTTQGYQAAPSALSQVAGMGMTGIAGLGLYNAMNQSDIRTKENIELVGWLPNGLPVYEFDYKPEFKDDAGHGRFRGVMAHDVEKIAPEAVGTMSNGYKGVRYAHIGAEMERV